jgi:RNA polymerase sigma-70 factor (ECF subfamily)
MEHGPDITSLDQNPLLMAGARDNNVSRTDIDVVSLVQRTLAGDSAAFGQIILRYERRVLTLSIRLLGTLDDAQDAAQEVFLRAFKYIHRLDLEKPLEPWLMQMTVNVCRDLGRKRQVRRNTFPELSRAETVPANNSCNPYSGLAEEQQRQMLWQALNELPEKERLAVILRDIEGLPTSEVATLLNSSETTVRSQVSRGRLRIKDAIDRITGGQL